MTTEVLQTVTRTGLFLALLAPAFWSLELLYPKVRNQLRVREWCIDVGWLLLGALTLNVVVGPLLAFIATPGGTQPFWRWVAAFLGAELMSYASHRAMHEVPWLWRFHAVHHAPTELDWLKSWRQHPLDVAIHAVCVAAPGLLLHVSFSSLGAVVLLRRVWTAFLHSNVTLRFGWAEALVSTPAFHHRHHQHGTPNANYAGLFPWVDRLFGTHG